MKEVMFIILIYLLGSVPYSYLIGRFWGGKEIQEEGSKSMGGTNVARVTGKFSLGIISTVLDMLMKGTTSVFIAYYVFGNNLMIVSMLSAAILGHIFPIFTRFRGGKGIATLIGGIFGLATLGLVPFSTFLIPVVLWVGTFGISIARFNFGIISLANLVFIFALLFFTWFSNQCWEFAVFALFIFSLITWAHRENIRRLQKAEEKGIVIKINWGNIDSLIAALKEKKAGESETVIKLNLENTRQFFQTLKEKKLIEIEFKK